MSYSLLPSREMQPTTMPTVTSRYYNKEKYEQYEMPKIVLTDNKGNKIKATFCNLFVDVSQIAS